VKKGLFLATMLVGAAIIPLAAEAKEQFPLWYVGLSGGVTFQDDGDWGTRNVEYDTGGNISGALGYKPVSAPGLRLEAEGIIFWNGIDSVNNATSTGDLNIGAGMLNALYDFIMEGSRWRPYIGVGAGIAKVDLDNAGGVSGSKYVPAYQAKVGIAYKPAIFYDVVDLTLGYRFFGTSDASIQGDDLSIMNHSVEAGARFNF
jgi:opacity protein-like surface antigen